MQLKTIIKHIPVSTAAFWLSMRRQGSQVLFIQLMLSRLYQLLYPAGDMSHTCASR